MTFNYEKCLFELAARHRFSSKAAPAALLDANRLLTHLADSRWKIWLNVNSNGVNHPLPVIKLAKTFFTALDVPRNQRQR